MRVAIIGGGASGLVAAIAASEKNKVTIFEKQGRVGKKLFASGNGKCNLSNEMLTRQLSVEKQNLFYNSKIAYDVVKKFDVDDLKDFCASVGIELMADEEGRIYPFSEYSGSVLDALRVKCMMSNVEVCVDTSVRKVEKIKGTFKIYLDNMDCVTFDKVIICVGSSIQARNFNGYEIAKELGFEISDLQPSLTPVRTQKVMLPLNGTRVKCKVLLKSCDKVLYEETGEVLFRDYGLSGIAIFNVSSFIARDLVNGLKNKYTVCLDLFPEVTQTQLLEKLTKRAETLGTEKSTFFVGMLTNKLAEEILKLFNNEKIEKESLPKLCNMLKCLTFDVADLCDSEKAQVMSGGIKTEQLDENFQAKNISGLYFAGECLNVDGICGGFNLHFAMATGYLAGKSV